MESLPATPPAPAVSAAAVTQLAYPTPVDMSPRSRSNESFEEPPLPLGPGSGGSKLRLMCSYGGHIVPRPHDKSLCYVGGDTRIVVADRHSSLADITSKLSKTLLGGRSFTVKYQLPNEDLDSLISVTTDEDLENMIDEYDRTSSQSSHKPSRLRLFLFSSKPESSSSIGSLLDSSAKSEDWFLNALNGSGLIDSPESLNSLLGLDSDCGGSSATAAAADGLGLPRDVDSRGGSIGSGKGTKQGQDVHSVPDSPLLETTSSFGSASSSPSLANLPPVRVHVEDGGAGVGSGGVRVLEQKSGIEEQFSQMGVSVAAAQKQDEGFVLLSSPSPPIPTTLVPAAAVSGEYANKVFSDEEQQSKPAQRQTQPLPIQSQQKPTSGGIDLPSPDSVSSDGSLTNAMSRQKAAVYQDPVGQLPSSGATNKVSADPVDPMTIMYDPNPRAQIGQQAQDTGYLFSCPQFEQQQIQQQQQQQQQQPQIQPQQYIQAGTHYIHHQMHPTGPVQIPSYYSVYPQQPHQPYPVYLVQARPSHPYNLSMAPPQSNMSEVGSNVPSGAPHPANMAQAAYGQTRTAPPAMPEMAASGIYRTGGSAGGSHLVQGPSGQQYVGFSQILHPAQSTASNSGATASNYAYEFADSAHGQIYYSQALPITLQPQYQNVMLSEAGSQQQQIRTSQPL